MQLGSNSNLHWRILPYTQTYCCKFRSGKLQQPGLTLNRKSSRVKLEVLLKEHWHIRWCSEMAISLEKYIHYCEYKCELYSLNYAPFNWTKLELIIESGKAQSLKVTPEATSTHKAYLFSLSNTLYFNSVDVHEILFTVDLVFDCNI